MKGRQIIETIRLLAVKIKGRQILKTQRRKLNHLTPRDAALPAVTKSSVCVSFLYASETDHQKYKH